jgi:hypothetical protein
MTADELKAAYETAKAVEADKAQEAEIFRKAHEARLKKEQLAQTLKQASVSEKQSNLAQQNDSEQKKPHGHKKHHKKHHEALETSAEVNAQYVNDHYDGKLSFGLENGARKHDYSTYTVDHYDSPKAGAGKGKGKGDKKGGKGVPPELAKKVDAKKKSKAQTESTPENVEKEIEGSATETISVVQKGKIYPNDHYDGKLSDGLYNGYTHNYSNYTVDHYDSKKPGSETVKSLASNATSANVTVMSQNSTVSNA